MKNSLYDDINHYYNSKKKKKSWSKLLVVLASLVVFTTTYALILPAITMNTQTWCGKEEHKHNHEECYEQVLICEKEETEGHTHDENCYEMTLLCNTEEHEAHVHEESCYENSLICQEEHEHTNECYENNLICNKEETEGHVHSDECYQNTVKCEMQENESHTHSDTCYEERFTCTKEEHEHTKICYSNPNADLEDASIWTETLPNELTGNWSNDLIEVAESQLGYKESKKNYIVTSQDITKGYTRYGEWYGDRYGDWCAMFISFCLNYANIDENLIPFDSNCQHWIETLSKEEYDLYHTKNTYQPTVGDLVFFDNDLNGVSDHVGIVIEVDNKLHTIEGNAGNGVYEKKYEFSNESILGYAKLPENPNIDNNYIKQTLNASIYKDASLNEIDESDNTKITVEGYLPEGASIKAFAVEIDQNVIDGESVMVAYDISVYDSNGNYIEIDNANNPLTVKILPQDLPSDIEDASVYYIPEEGEPEELTSEKKNQELTFETPHFSTYAITIPGNLAEVYLNGTGGNDTNAGTSSTRAVKTLEKALSLVKDGGTIHITGTVTLTSDVDLDVLGSLTIKRSSFTGPLIILHGAELTLGNVTINGGSSKPQASATPKDYSSSTNIARYSTYANNSAKAPLIVIQNGGTLNIKDGTTLEYNSNKPNTKTSGSGNSQKTDFVENGYVGQGGAVYCDNGTINMNGGLIQYCEAESGGGIYIENGTFNLSDGTIQYNYARNILTTSQRRQEQYYRNAGGGVYVGDHTVMNMSGGMIVYNESSREGGGVSLGWLNRARGAAINEFITTFNMTGGTFKGNVATSTGGALNITAGRQAFISAGSFLDNVANGKEYQETSSYSIPGSVYSGGAIYLDAQQEDSYGRYSGMPGYAVINRVLITENTATSDGGAIATCSTSKYSINASVDLSNGTLIYNNKKGTSKNELYLSGSKVNMSDTYLGGGKYNWKTSGSIYYNDLTNNSTGVKAGIEMATVIIKGNTGYLGGAIGCNGQIEIGGEDEKISISFTKIWEDQNSIYRPKSITVQVYQDGKPYGDPITFSKSTDDSGDDTWPTYHIDSLPSGHEYTIKEIEVDGYISTITQNGNHFTITNTFGGFRVVKKWENDTEEDRPSSIQVQLYQNNNPYGNIVQLTKDNNWQYIWTELPEFDADGNKYEYSAKEINIPNGYYSTSSGVLKGNTWTITNTLAPKTNISVEKKWSEGSTKTDVTILLLANGEINDTVILNGSKNWYHKFTNLPTKDKNGIDINYEITEVKIPGYTFEVSDGMPINTTQKQSTWIETTKLISGKKHIFINNNQILSGKGTNQLQWINVGNHISEGTIPSNEAVWTFNGSTLRNESNKYLNVGYDYSYYNYLIKTSDNGSTVSYSNNNLAAIYRYNNYDYYYYMTSISNNYGYTSRSYSDALTFKTYYLDEKEVEVDGNCTHYIVTNTKKDELFINFNKYSTLKDEDGNFTLLANANLALYKQDDNGTTDIPETNAKGTLVKEWVTTNISSEQVNLQEDGTYYLVELNAPDGHVKLKGPIIFEVNTKSQTIKIKSYPGFEECEGELSLENSTADLPIYNTVAFLLPETGGMGTSTIYLIGGLLVLVSVIVLITKKRMNNEI